MANEFMQDFGGNLPNLDLGAYTNWTGAPAANTSLTNFNETLKIVGYIAGRKNALAQDINEEEAKRAFEEAKTHALDEAGRDSINVPKIDAKGETKGDTIEIKRDTKYTKTGLRALDKEAYDRAMEGYYKVNLKETRPEVLAVEITSRQGKSATDALDLDEGSKSIQGRAKAYSDNAQFFLIKESELVKALLEHETKRISVQNDGVAVGSAIPFMKQSTKDAKKFTIKFTYIDEQQNPVKGGIGYMGVPYAVNRDYVGDVPADKVVITNEDKVRELYPGMNIDEIGMTKEFVKFDDGTTMRSREEIDYDVYANAYKKMGVSEKMLEALRGSKSTSYNAVTIDEIYTNSKKAYELYKRAE